MFLGPQIGWNIDSVGCNILLLGCDCSLGKCVAQENLRDAAALKIKLLSSFYNRIVCWKLFSFPFGWNRATDSVELIFEFLWNFVSKTRHLR